MHSEYDSCKHDSNNHQEDYNRRTSDNPGALAGRGATVLTAPLGWPTPGVPSDEPCRLVLLAHHFAAPVVLAAKQSSTLAHTCFVTTLEVTGCKPRELGTTCDCKLLLHCHSHLLCCLLLGL